VSYVIEAQGVPGVNNMIVVGLNLTIDVMSVGNAPMIKKQIAKKYQIKIIKGVDMDNDRGKFDEVTGSHFREMLKRSYHV
jgi:hypothetical protein